MTSVEKVDGRSLRAARWGCCRGCGCFDEFGPYAVVCTESADQDQEAVIERIGTHEKAEKAGLFEAEATKQNR
jgi:hypothetical protein